MSRFSSPGARLKLLTALVIAAYFFLLTWQSLYAFFTPDDMMNLYRSWVFPTSQLVKANLLFFLPSPYFRPMGSVWYSAIFHFAGFDALPFHVANLAILAANIFLTYAVARRLSGSAETGALTALLGCYHTAFAYLYFDTGYIYDVLCYFFYFSTFLLYLTIRGRNRHLGAGALAACSLLYICALNSKEIGLTLPAFLFLYEWLYNPPQGYSVRELRRWTFAEGRGTLVLGLIMAIFAIGRAFGPDSLLHIAPYVPVFTWSRFRDNTGDFLHQLFFRDRRFAPWEFLSLWTVMLAVAWIAKSRVLKFAWFFVMLSVIPVVFIQPRLAPQYYLPLFGWALYAAEALVRSSRLLVRPFSQPRRAPVERWRPLTVFAIVLLLLFPFYRARGWANVGSVTGEAPVVRSIALQMHDLHPTMRPGARVFFFDDPYPSDWENMIFVLRLSYANDGIMVDRMKKMTRRPTDRELASYDYVFDYRGGRFFELHSPWQTPRDPMFIYLAPDGAEIFHGDWSPVSSLSPAHPGEALIAKAVDVGATTPPVDEGQPFPKDPLARVVSEAQVRVNGRDAEVLEKLGWPERVNLYRVDFRVPRETPPGIARVDLSVDGRSGPPVRIPVR